MPDRRTRPLRVVAGDTHPSAVDSRTGLPKNTSPPPQYVTIALGELAAESSIASDPYVGRRCPARFGSAMSSESLRGCEGAHVDVEVRSECSTSGLREA